MRHILRNLKSCVATCLCVVFFCHWLGGPATGAGKRETDRDAGQRVSEREKQREREKRLVLRSLEDLRFLLSLVEAEQGELAREVDAITPLEPSSREYDLRDVMELFDNYGDWLREHEAEFDADLTTLSSGSAERVGLWPGRFAAMSAGFGTFEARLTALSKRFDEEGKRLAALIDHRRLLQGRLSSLEEQLAVGMRKSAQRGGATRDNNDAVRLRTRINVVQSELSTLPLVGEDTLKHFFSVGERARAGAAWMAVKSDEYAFLSDIAAIISGAPARNRPVVEATISRLRRVNGRMVNRLGQRIDAIDRKQSLVSPSGSLQELQRSGELRELYQTQKQRYGQYVNRLKIQAGELEADMGELIER
jgi:hypothetical protein